MDVKYKLSPARPSLSRSDREGYNRNKVPPISPYSGFFPKTVAKQNGIQKYRENQLLQVSVFPIQYNYEMETVRVYTTISYHVKFIRQEINHTKGNTLTSTPTILPDNFLSNITLNYEQESLTKGDSPPQPLGGRGYLILTTPKFRKAVDRFAEWKRLLGFTVRVISLEKWKNPATIRQFVKYAYNKNPDTAYLLIVGDHENVPGELHDQFFPHVTDLYYGCLDGPEDKLPDLYRGRLSVSTLEEANTVIDKIIEYEQTPNTTPEFYLSGLNCAYFQDNKPTVIGDGYEDLPCVQVSETIRDYLIGQGKSVSRVYNALSLTNPTNWNNGKYSYGETIPQELRRPQFEWNGSASDILERINSGTFYTLYNGHGDSINWEAPYFERSHINQLSNRDKLPVIFSICCQTGKFNTSSSCFAETFLRKANGGCIAIYAATENAFARYSDALLVGMFDAIWPTPGLSVNFPSTITKGGTTSAPTYTLGQILDQGLARMAESCNAISLSQYTRETFHCFGDPAMRIYTEVPTTFSNVSVQRKQGSIVVSLPEVATINLFDRISGKVHSYQASQVVQACELSDCVSVSVTGHNRIPYIDMGEMPLFIRNTEVVGPKTYEAKYIKMGTAPEPIRNLIGKGPVVLKSGNITFRANTIVIDSVTILSKDANITLTNQIIQYGYEKYKFQGVICNITHSMDEFSKTNLRTNQVFQRDIEHQRCPQYKTFNFNIARWAGMYWTCFDKFFQLDVSPQNPRLAGTGNTIVLYNTATATYNNLQVANIYNYSDLRAKEDVKTLRTGMNKLLALRPVSYYWKSSREELAKIDPNSKEVVSSEIPFGPDENVLQYGFLAQEVEKVIPNAVTTNIDGHKLINYTAMIPMLVQAIQDLQTTVEHQALKIEELTKENFASKTRSKVSVSGKIVSISPNPTTGYATIALKVDKTSSNVRLRITNMYGTLAKDIPFDSNKESTDIDVSSLQNGIYIVSLYVDGELCDSSRLIKD